MSEGRLRVALTIDTEHPDRPGGDPEGAKVVDTLRVERAPATFFLQGRWVLANPDVAAQIAGDGHQIGNHSFFHARMPRLTDDGIAYDLATAQEAIIEVTGIDPRPWFRCPWGDGHDDPRVLTAVAAAGYRDVHWHVDSDDWDPPTRERALVEKVLDAVAQHGDGTIVLMHSWPAITARVLPALLDALRDAGAEPVRLDELVAA